MAKFRGLIGYAQTSETAPGVWTENIIERTHSGDVIRNTRKWQNGESLNDDLVMNNTISIIANSFASANFHTMRYINWMGASWKITNVDYQKPRLILTIGGVYNGPKVGSSGSS
jgi:hypothetical protein